MLISIIVPVYQTKQYLGKLVESVVSQSFTDFELILVDNASTDGCSVLCDNYAQADSRIQVIHLNNNEGPSIARNIGIRHAAGQYIALMDSDDYLVDMHVLKSWADKILFKLPDLIVYRVVTGDGASQRMIGNNNFQIDSIDKLTYFEALEALIKSGCFYIAPWGKIIRRTFLQEQEAFFPERQRWEDLDWSMQLYFTAKTVCGINVPSYYYLIRPSSTSKIKFELHQLENLHKVIKKWVTLIQNDSTFPQAVRSALLGYFAYQYYILIASASVLNTQERFVIFEKCKELEWLIQFASNTKMKVCAMLHRLFGASITGGILCLARKIKG